MGLAGVLTLLPQWSAAWLLMSLRIGAMLMMTPIFHARYIPLTVRVLIVLALAATLGGVWNGAAAEPAHLWRAAFSELALGATLGLGILFAFAAISFGGRLVDVMVGFGMAQVIDPVTQRHIPVLSALLDLFGLTLFFLLDGHHALLRGLAHSLEIFPLGAAWPLESALGTVVAQFAGLFGLGFILVAPVVLCLLMVELALGVVARTLPQMNMLLVGIPVKIAVGVFALWAWVYGLSFFMQQVFARIAAMWTSLFVVAGGAAR